MLGWNKMRDAHGDKTCCLCGENFGWIMNRGEECANCNKKVPWWLEVGRWMNGCERTSERVVK